MCECEAFTSNIQGVPINGDVILAKALEPARKEIKSQLTQQLKKENQDIRRENITVNGEEWRWNTVKDKL